MNMVYTRIHVCVYACTHHKTRYTQRVRIHHTHTHARRQIPGPAMCSTFSDYKATLTLHAQKHTHTCVLIYYNIGGYIYIYTFIIYIYIYTCVCDDLVNHICVCFFLCVCVHAWEWI